MRLGAVDPDGDLSAGGAELLEESAVSPDPQVLLCDLHLRRRRRIRISSLTQTTDSLSSVDVRTYSTQVPRARRGVQTQEQPGDGDHVVLHKRLSENRETLR